MKGLLTVLIFFYAFSCAPVSCPDTEGIKALYSQSNSPKDYSAVLSAKYGPLKVHIFVEKKDEQYNIKTLGPETVSYKDKHVCINSMCVYLPINLEGLIFGTVLEGDEKVRCNRDGVVFEKEDSAYLKRYVFLNGQPKTVEVLEKKKNKTFTLNYGEKTKEGYYNNLNLNLGNMNLKISIDDVKMF